MRSYVFTLLTLLFCLGSLSMGLAQNNCLNCPGTTNLVTDGSFSTGSSTLAASISSDLNPLCSCNYPPPNGSAGYGSYCIDVNAVNKCANFNSVPDHTTGTGGYMIIDGFNMTTTANVVWKESVTVATPGNYRFSFWWYPNVSYGTNNTPTFNLLIDNQVVASNIGVGPMLNSWNEYCDLFTLSTAGAHTIELVQTNFAGGGNDYGIDDIFFGKCCECQISATYSTTFTPTSTINFTANVTTSACTNLTSAFWDFGDGNGGTGVQVSHTYAAPGWYVVTLTVTGATPDGDRCRYRYVNEVYVPEPSCDVVSSFITTQIGTAEYEFLNQSTASTPMNYQWTISDITGPGFFVYYSTATDIMYTFPQVGTYEVCLVAIQPAFGNECFDKSCQIVNIGAVNDFLEFDIDIGCGSSPQLYLDYLNFSSPGPVTVTVSCTGDPIAHGPFTLGNTIPPAQPVLLASMSAGGYGTCYIKVEDQATGLLIDRNIYFNCQLDMAVSELPDTEVSSSEQAEALSLTLHPNPVTGSAVVLSLMGLSDRADVVVRNINGRVVQQTSIDTDNETATLRLDVSDWPNGTYFLSLNDGTETVTKKLVITE